MCFSTWITESPSFLFSVELSVGIKFWDRIKSGFDFWNQDFNCDGGDARILASRTVLHDLAHMAMNVSITDCQIYAGAPVIHGRNIGSQDYERVRQKMQKWSSTVQAWHATLYALHLLSNASNHSSHYDYYDLLHYRSWALYLEVLG